MEKINLLEELNKYKELSDDEKLVVDNAFNNAELTFMPEHTELKRRIKAKLEEYLKIQQENPDDAHNNKLCRVFNRFNRISEGKHFPQILTSPKCIESRNCK